MNSSSISVCNNVSRTNNLSKSYKYRKLNDLLHVDIEFGERIFCPLCVDSFSFKFSLFEHLRMFHESFLTRVSNESLKFKKCPFCQAKFYGKHLTAKHVLHHHFKFIKELFVNKNMKCFFCNVKLNKGDHSSVMNHFEELHFLDFEEEFRKIFSCDTSQQMSMSELINSTIQDKDLSCANWEDVCMKFEKPPVNNADTKTFDEGSRINSYDFTELKQQLENINNVSDMGVSNSGININEFILKDSKNCSISKRSARRLLRFDLSFNYDKHKENSFLEKKLCSFAQICMDERNLLCNRKSNLFFKPNNTFNDNPQHFSTPNFKYNKIPQKNKKNLCFKSNFKSYISQNKITNFEFQCGKCRLLFKENLELVFHVKNKHKKFGLKAIFNARFYKNQYLKKHHILHKPY